MFNQLFTGIPDFSSITISASGIPTAVVTSGSINLSTTTLDVTSATTFTGTHTLTIDVFQTGLLGPPSLPVNSTFTINHLTGAPFGPSTLSDYYNGTTTTLGTLLNSSTFLAGVTTSTVGPVANAILPGTSADAEQFVVTFTGGGQEATDTIQLVSVPGPVVGAGLPGLLAGCLALVALARRRLNRFA
jgi:hypothetical protein